jgi:hypothetical protein
MYRTAEDTACLLAVLLNRSGQTRARVSAKTIKKLGNRLHLRSSFVVQLADALSSQYDWIIFELMSGGYGAVQAKALEAAKAVTGMRLLTPAERKAITRGSVDIEAFRKEAATDLETPDDEDDDG